MSIETYREITKFFLYTAVGRLSILICKNTTIHWWKMIMFRTQWDQVQIKNFVIIYVFQKCLWDVKLKNTHITDRVIKGW